MTYLFMAVCERPRFYFIALSFSIFLGTTKASIMQVSFWMAYVLFTFFSWVMVRLFYQIVMTRLSKKSHDIAHSPLVKRVFISMSLVFGLYLPICLLFGIRGSGMNVGLLLLLVLIFFFFVAQRLKKRLSFAVESIFLRFLWRVVLGWG